MQSETLGAFDRAQRNEAKRRAIIVTAAQAFHEHGYADTSLDEVARRLNVTKKTLYYYIENKNKILVELFHLWLDTQEASVNHAEALDDTALAKLAAYTRHYIHSVLALSAPIDRVANEISALSPDDKRQIDRRRNRNDNRLRGILAQGMQSGEIRACNEKIAHYVMHGAIDWFFKYYKPRGALSADQVIDEILDVLFLGLQANR